MGVKVCYIVNVKFSLHPLFRTAFNAVQAVVVQGFCFIYRKVGHNLLPGGGVKLQGGQAAPHLKNTLAEAHILQFVVCNKSPVWKYPAFIKSQP